MTANLEPTNIVRALRATHVRDGSRQELLQLACERLRGLGAPLAQGFYLGRPGAPWPGVIAGSLSRAAPHAAVDQAAAGRAPSEGAAIASSATPRTSGATLTPV